MEFVSATPPVSRADLRNNACAVAVSLSDSDCQVHLASTTGLWDQSVLHLWLYYFDSLLAGAAISPDTPCKVFAVWLSIYRLIGGE